MITQRDMDHFHRLLGARRAPADKGPQSAEEVAAFVVAAGKVRRGEALTDSERRIIAAA